MSVASFTTAINYPESDGKPMGETDLHRDAMFRQIELLKRFFAGQKVYVSGDLLVYYEPGNNKKFIVPDVFFTKGLKQVQRRIYRTWIERLAPNFVIETTSKKTKKRDLEVKPEIYAIIGVQEYFLFDPTKDYLEPPLQGNRLVDGAYQSIPRQPDGSLTSEQLGLKLRFNDGELEFIQPDTNQRLCTAEEELENEATARLKAEQEADRLREELRLLRESTKTQGNHDS